jgi:hypothetical protein
MKKFITLIISIICAANVFAQYPLPDTRIYGTLRVDSGAVVIDTLGVYTESATKPLVVKDTASGLADNATYLQLFGNSNGSFRTGVYLNGTAFGLGNGITYPFTTPPTGSFIAGVNNNVTSVNPLLSGSSIFGHSSLINESIGAGSMGASNNVDSSNYSFIFGQSNTIDNGNWSGILASQSTTIYGTRSAIVAATDAVIGDGPTNNTAIIASSSVRADSALSFVIGSFQSAARSDHGSVINAYRAYASYYHQLIWGSQPIVDTTGFTFDISSTWNLNSKYWTVGNGGAEDEGSPSIRETNSITQIANGNILFGTHWKDVYDDLDTNSAIVTVMNDSVAGDMIFAAINKDRDTTLTISEDALTYIDGNQSDGYVLTSDANGLATWQAPPSFVIYQDAGSTTTTTAWETIGSHTIPANFLADDSSLDIDFMVQGSVGADSILVLFGSDTVFFDRMSGVSHAIATTGKVFYRAAGDVVQSAINENTIYTGTADNSSPTTVEVRAKSATIGNQTLDYLRITYFE